LGRQLPVFTDHDWTDWLPTLAWVIELAKPRIINLSGTVGLRSPRQFGFVSDQVRSGSVSRAEKEPSGDS
jgi:hypothetical protein